MAPRLEPLASPVYLFAHRGASAVAPENTLEAFATATSMGANALESDVWITSDGVVVCDHDGKVGSFLRKKPISSMPRSALPAHIPDLEAVISQSGAEIALSLDVKDPEAIAATVETVRRFDQASSTRLVERTWPCHPDQELLAMWRSRFSDVKLVHSRRSPDDYSLPESHAASLVEAGIDAVNYRYPTWSGGLAAMYHRFGLFCFGWDVQLERVATELLDMGLDGIFGNYVDRLVTAHERVYGHRVA